MVGMAAGAQHTPQNPTQSSQQSEPSIEVKPSPPAEATPLSQQQAQELLQSVDGILQFASEDTKLPLHHPVKREIVSRDEANRYFAEKMKQDKGVQQIEHSEVVLKKFGLLDHDFHLEPFMMSLLTEQVAGYYDPKTKTINLLNWVAPELQKPVLAHELTHSLQDQHVDLNKWSEVTHFNLAKNVSADNEHIRTDEADTAREAVLEGQAMVVFADYGLRDAKKTLADAPEIAQKMADLMGDNSDSPVMARAPLMLQETLVFPYREGLEFEAAVLKNRGVEGAFAGVLDQPPSSSFEILTPDAYLAQLPVPVLRMPDIHPLIEKDWVPYDVGVMGELDVRILTEAFAGQEQAAAIAPMWDGGIFYAAQRRSAKSAEEKASTASLGLIYYSRWKNEDTARSFARVYAAQLPRKYSGLKARVKDQADENELVYSTPEGDVLMKIDGAGVYVSEGFDLATARKLEEQFTAAQATGPVQQASAGHELTLGMARRLAQFGAMRADIEAAAAAH